MATKVNASAEKFGYGPSSKAARKWSLYISTSRGKSFIGIEAPVLFSAPGVFIVRPNRTQRCGAMPIMPFAPLPPHIAYIQCTYDQV